MVGDDVLEEVQACFALEDPRRSGYIDMEAAIRAMQMLGYNPSRIQLSMIMREHNLDPRQSNSLNVIEVCESMSRSIRLFLGNIGAPHKNKHKRDDEAMDIARIHVQFTVLWFHYARKADEEVHVLKAAFQALDENQSGSISKVRNSQVAWSRQARTPLAATTVAEISNAGMGGGGVSDAHDGDGRPAHG